MSFVLNNPVAQAPVPAPPVAPAPVAPAPKEPVAPVPKAKPQIKVLAPIEHVLSFSSSINALDLALSGETEILEGYAFWDSFDAPPKVIDQTIGLRLGVEFLDSDGGLVYNNPDDLTAPPVPLKKLMLPYGDIGGRTPFFLIAPKGTYTISVYCSDSITVVFTSRIIIKGSA